MEALGSVTGASANYRGTTIAKRTETQGAPSTKYLSTRSDLSRSTNIGPGVDAALQTCSLFRCRATVRLGKPGF